MLLKSKIIFTIYKIITAIIAPLGLIFLCYKRRKDPSYGKKVFELLGYYRQRFNKCVCFHAASFGEVNSLRPLIEAFIKKFPDEQVVLTTMTTTGALAASKISGITVLFSPLDSPCAVRRFFRRINPKALFIIDTELWPNMLNAAHKAKCKIVLVNARMQEKNCIKYQNHIDIVKDIISSNLDRVICSSKDAAERFNRIGVPHERICVSGNIKYDLAPNEQRFGSSRQFKENNVNGMVIGAISTHDGEEKLLIDAFLELKKKFKQLSLVLVPRHASGIKLAADLLKDRKQKFYKRNAVGETIPNFTNHILLGNTIGEIETYFGLCDLVFMGGSFTEVGGHNPLEPAYFAIPSITGPNYWNFQETFDKLIDTEGAFLASDYDSLVLFLNKLLKDRQLIEKAGIRALDVQQEGRGALKFTIEQLANILDSGKE